MNHLEIDKIVKIETLPKIFYELEKVGEYLDEELAKTKDLVATEDNKQEVKKIRTNINNTLEAFETRRKEIKNQCLEAYTLFEEKYNSEVKVKLTNASEDLKSKIVQIENEQLRVKANEVYDFIKEHIIANHLENILIIDQVIETAKLKINLSTSLKSLKDDSKAFIERVANEVKLIELENAPSNLLYEYKTNGFDLTKAKLTLLERQKQIIELAKQREEVQEVVEQEEKVAEVVEEIVAPKEIVSDDEILEVSFTIRTTKDKIIKLKEFLNENEINYN